MVCCRVRPPNGGTATRSGPFDSSHADHRATVDDGVGRQVLAGDQPGGDRVAELRWELGQHERLRG